MESLSAPEALSKRFRNLEILGAGGFGAVYAATDTQTGQRIALKRLHRVDPASLYRFKQEFRALADVTHPNLVQLHELFAVEDAWWFSMELVDGINFIDHVGLPSLRISQPPTVDERRREDVPAAHAPTMPAMRVSLPPSPALALAEPDPDAPAPALDAITAEDEAARIARLRSCMTQLAAGIRALHAAGRLHRDLKPSNVLVTQSGRVVILDFGLVAELAVDGVHETMDSMVAGTPSYMAPEQAMGEPMSPASDWFSMGVMLFEALTGRLPFRRDLGRMADSFLVAAPDPRKVRPGLPDDLCDLVVELLHVLPGDRPREDHIAAVLGLEADSSPFARPRTRFVGRAEALAALGAALQDVRAEHPVLVHVRGRSGMGKTALVRHFVDGAARGRLVVALEGRCYERESVPYKAVDNLVDALTRTLVGLPDAEVARLVPAEVAALARLFPVLRRVRAIDAVPRARDLWDAHELRRRGFAALRELLARLGERRRVILWIDDGHWGDADSAALLHDVLRPPHPPAVLLVVAYRGDDAESSAFLRALAKAPVADVRAIDVGPLDPEALRALAAAEAVEGEPALTPDQLGTVERESGGSPFLALAMARHLRSGARASTTSLAELIEAHVATLPEDDRRLLATVAVAGRPVPRAVAGRAAGFDGDEAQAVQRLQAGFLLRVRPGSTSEEIEPWHDRVRETVTASLEDDVKRRIHLELGQALESTSSADAETLAAHFEAAGDSVRTRVHTLRAAERAAEALAFDRAAVLYRRALAQSTPEESHAVRVQLARALANAGRGSEAARLFLEAAGEATGAEVLDLDRAAAEQFLRSGHIEEGLQVLREVLSSVGMRLPPTPTRALLSLLARRVVLRVRGFGFDERPEEAVDPRELSLIDVLWSAGNGLGAVDMIRGADFQARHVIHALRAGEPRRIARALSWEGILGVIEGGSARRRGRALLASARAHAEERGDQHSLGWATAGSAITAWIEGRWRESIEHCEESMRMFREQPLDSAWEIASVNAYFLLPALFAVGDVPELERRAAEAVEEALTRGDVYAVTCLRTYVMPLVRLAQDDPARAIDETRGALDRWGSTHGWHLQHWMDGLSQTQARLYAGDVLTARTTLRHTVAESRRAYLLRMDNIHRITLQVQARVHAAAAALEGTPLAIRDLERDVALLEKTGAPWLGHLGTLLTASLLARAGDRARAAALCETAARGFELDGMALYAAAAFRRHAELVGDRERVAEADARMASLRVVRPERMAAFLAPGFDTPPKALPG